MAAYPAMPLFTDAYLADTRHLTTEEHGAYLLLLMCAWRSRECALVDDDGALARIAGLSPTKWRRMKPVLQSFFDIEGGLWRQAKLTSVYADVAARVARNRASGAKGGRARALKRSAKPGPEQSPAQSPTQNSGQATGENPRQSPAQSSERSSERSSGQHSEPVPEQQSRKSLNQHTQQKAQQTIHQNTHHSASENKATKTKAAAKPDSLVLDSAGHWHQELSVLCGPSVVLDGQTLAAWQAAGADFEVTIKPTIKRLMAREQKRTGTLPKRLAYFREAVLEAHADAPPPAIPQSDKTPFEPESAAHWRRLLGDPSSAFRGDYMSQNWFIPADHPEFAARTLGANPRFSSAPLIPAEIRAEYGRAWNWLAVP